METLMLLYEANIMLLYTNKALTLVPTRVSESGHFEVTGKLLLAKQRLDSVALTTPNSG